MAATEVTRSALDLPSVIGSHSDDMLDLPCLSLFGKAIKKEGFLAFLFYAQF